MSHAHPNDTAPTARVLLDQVTQRINHYQALKLPDLQTELKAFVDLQDQKVKDYTTRFGALRDRWCAMQERVKTLYSQIQCAYPDQSWRDIIRENVCPALRDRDRHQTELDERQAACRGTLEKKLAQAQKVLASRRARLDALKGNADGVSATLDANEALLTKVQGELAQTETRASALYTFWFQLLPAHKNLTPEDAGDENRAFAKDETPARLCTPTESEAAAEGSDDEHAQPARHQGSSAGSPRQTAPWLMLPAGYGARLDRAWNAYHQASLDAATADADFHAAPDDQASLATALDAENQGLEQKIRGQLLKVLPPSPCPKPNAASN